jgi:hypothetical protein
MSGAAITAAGTFPRPPGLLFILQPRRGVYVWRGEWDQGAAPPTVPASHATTQAQAYGPDGRHPLHPASGRHLDVTV